MYCTMIVACIDQFILHISCCIWIATAVVNPRSCGCPCTWTCDPKWWHMCLLYAIALDVAIQFHYILSHIIFMQHTTDLRIGSIPQTGWRFYCMCHCMRNPQSVWAWWTLRSHHWSTFELNYIACQPRWVTPPKGLRPRSLIPASHFLVVRIIWSLIPYSHFGSSIVVPSCICLLYTSDAADE